MALGKNANILAAVIVGTVLLAGGALLLSQLGSDESKVDAQQRITAEADTTMRQAISMGVDQWLRNGFSDQNVVWYASGPVPPDFDEALASLNTIVNDNVDDYMSRLQSEHEDYYIAPEVKVNFMVSEPVSGSDLTELNAKASEFKVGLKSEESSQIEDISTNYNYPYKAWMMYENMYQWMQDNADQITQNLYSDALLAQPCQLVSGGCDCADPDVEFTEEEKNSIRLKESQVTPVLDEAVQALSDMFSGQGITCSYTVDMMNIENTEKEQWAQGDVGPNGTLKVIPRSDYSYTLERWVDEQRTRPKGDSCDGLPQAQGGSGVGDDCTVRPLLLDSSSQPVDDGTVQAYEEPDPDNNEECYGYVHRMGGEANLAGTMLVGMLAMDKKLAVLMTVKCQDPKTSIETASGLEPMTAEIKLRLAIALDCPLPASSKDLYVDQSIYPDEVPGTCPGGSCFPAGTMISMADGTSKPIEDVKVGDEVLSYNTYSGNLRAGTVLELEAPVREGLYTIVFTDGSSIQVTNEHPFYTKKASGETGWASIMPEETYKETKSIDNVMPLNVGDSIMRLDKSWAEIAAITYDQGKVQTYNLKEVSAYDNYFADDLLAHNKCCFLAGTPVTMSDGTTKPIEDVKVGDFVLTYNLETDKLEPSEVLSLQQPVRDGYYEVTFENGKVLKVTNDHPLYTEKGWAAIEVDAALAGYALSHIEKLEVGDSVLQDDLTYARIVSIKYHAGDVQTYTLKKVAKNKNFFANGFLAHNQKMIGYVGLMCPLDCEPCYGCAPADGVTQPRQNVPSDWQCIGPLPNLICSKCGLCDASGGCTIPQYAGYPCFDDNGDNMMEGNIGAGVNYADCWACDGSSAGDDACVMNPPAITSLIDVACEGGQPCSKCSGNGLTPAAGGCTAPITTNDMMCNDLSIPEEQRSCMICPVGSAGACAADPTMDGEACGACATCSNGVCDAPAPDSVGECSTDALPCRKCHDTFAGQCQVDMSMNDECGTCQMCGSDGSCVADTSKNGQSCGTCKECSNGQCVAANDGEQCRSSNGCTWTCQSGDCRIANEGSGCTLSGNSCDLNQRCTSSGCETTSADQQYFCCGTAKCPLGSQCCTYTNKCEPCPTPT